MSRRSRHGRRPQPSLNPQEKQPDDIDAIGAATATAPGAAEAVALPVEPERFRETAPADARVDAGAEPGPRSAGPAAEPPTPEADGLRTTCTQAQLRRFIKSRPWIPMHELRRRFGIFGPDDDVSPVRVGDGTIFVGLPAAEARMLGELLSGGDVGYELSLDPGAPIVVGVYPMRPVPRG